ncbi:MAG: M20/M25/M40 family metallo-hydrolase [Bacteroidetes bacterium]|nr:MAG: M20/M25/M40 family metallo-hydrolase [Bacteroidota bacterium]
MIPAGLMAQTPEADLQDLRVDVVYLASDLLKGRETGTPGEDLAAQYIATRFEEEGLTPKGTKGWFQPFDFEYKANPHAESGEPRTGKNVIGYLDNGAEYTVVIGAHYDHLGMGGSGSLFPGEAIHNGADDNASGVAAMIYLAKKLKNNPRAKHNNYLFIAFSGEELGLFGSKYFTGHPTIDLKKVNYMINMDMVGRLNEGKVLAINGAGTSPVWKEALARINVANITPKTSDSGIGPSDHTSFYLEDIPVLHFFTGQHTDYHKPSDDSELVNYEGIYQVAHFILQLIEDLDGSGKLAFTKTKDEQQRQGAAFKVTLGVMPDYVYDGEGMRIDAVIDGRPAEKGGLKKGDIIIKIGAQPVKDIYDYMEGLAQYKKGDKAKVRVRRGDEIKEFEVKF